MFSLPSSATAAATAAGCVLAAGSSGHGLLHPPLAGEVNFSLPGLAYQLASVVTESVRLVLMQLLLQSRGLRLNPITTLYYVAPCCFVALLVPFLFLEAGTLWAEPRLRIPPALLLASALAAFGERR